MEQPKPNQYSNNTYIKLQDHEWAIVTACLHKVGKAFNVQTALEIKTKINNQLHSEQQISTK